MDGYTNGAMLLHNNSALSTTIYTNKFRHTLLDLRETAYLCKLCESINCGRIVFMHTKRKQKDQTFLVQT